MRVRARLRRFVGVVTGGAQRLSEAVSSPLDFQCRTSRSGLSRGSPAPIPVPLLVPSAAVSEVIQVYSRCQNFWWYFPIFADPSFSSAFQGETGFFSGVDTILAGARAARLVRLPGRGPVAPP